MTVEPISPSQLVKIIPEEIIKIFNELIQQKWNGREARITQPEVVDKILSDTLFERAQIFGEHMLDVEDLFRKKGWRVTFDKAGYNESYDSYFVFTT